jgi:chemotaxis protein CheD
MARIVVKMGELTVSEREDDELTAILGSCVGVVLYDTEKCRAGMAHVMLPERIDLHSGTEKKTKYAVPAVLELYRQMLELGSRKYCLKAKLVGGARMFGENNLQNIGERNLEMTKYALRRLNIPIAAERTGGLKGINVNVNVATARVRIRDAEGREEEI